MDDADGPVVVNQILPKQTLVSNLRRTIGFADVIAKTL